MNKTIIINKKNLKPNCLRHSCYLHCISNNITIYTVFENVTSKSKINTYIMYNPRVQYKTPISPSPWTILESLDLAYLPSAVDLSCNMYND